MQFGLLLLLFFKKEIYKLIARCILISIIILRSREYRRTVGKINAHDVSEFRRNCRLMTDALSQSDVDPAMEIESLCRG